MINNHLLWFIVMIVCLLIEAGTFELTIIWFAAGSFVAMLLSFAGISLQSQIVFFLLISLALLISTRPYTVKRIKMKKKSAESKRISALNKCEIQISGIAL